MHLPLTLIRHACFTNKLTPTYDGCGFTWAITPIHSKAEADKAFVDQVGYENSDRDTLTTDWVISQFTLEGILADKLTPVEAELLERLIAREEEAKKKNTNRLRTLLHLPASNRKSSRIPRTWFYATVGHPLPKQDVYDAEYETGNTMYIADGQPHTS